MVEQPSCTTISWVCLMKELNFMFSLKPILQKNQQLEILGFQLHLDIHFNSNTIIFFNFCCLH